MATSSRVTTGKTVRRRNKWEPCYAIYCDGGWDGDEPRLDYYLTLKEARAALECFVKNYGDVADITLLKVKILVEHDWCDDVCGKKRKKPI